MTNNSIGVSNVGGNISVAPLKMLGDSGLGSMSGLLSALEYAIDQDMDIVNMSLTTSPEPLPSSGLEDAIIATYEAGVILVAAAGNQNGNVKWPAAYDETVAVAATNSADGRWVTSSTVGSNYGPEVDIAAPGQYVLSTINGSGYAEYTGTSMATPHVSALFGLLRSLRPDLTNNQLLAIVKDTADDVNASTYPGDDDYLGAGRVNYYDALLAASDDLTLSFASPLEAYVAPGSSVSFDVVTKDGNGSQPIENASVYVQYLTAGAASESSSVTSAATTVWREFTNAAGKASFTVTAPSSSGDYVLRVQVGAAVMDTDIMVNLPPELNVDSTELAVATGSTPFEVRVLHADGLLVSGNTQLQLETTIGQFELGATEVTTVAVDGLYTSTLYAGTQAGVGTLTVSTAKGFASKQITVQPGEPVTVNVKQLPGFTADLVNMYIPFETSLKDVYGNGVSDGTQVQVTDSISEVNDMIATASGSASFEVAAPHSYYEPVYVTALIPETNISHTVEAINILPKLYMPQLERP